MKIIVILAALLSVLCTSLQVSAAEPATIKAEKVKKVATKKATRKARKAKGGKGSRVTARFEKMDTNSNGEISEAEFTNFQLKHFKRKDKNKDGSLSKAEFSPFFKK